LRESFRTGQQEQASQTSRAEAFQRERHQNSFQMIGSYSSGFPEKHPRRSGNLHPRRRIVPAKTKPTLRAPSRMAPASASPYVLFLLRRWG
jgi:hypothetical protein